MNDTHTEQPSQYTCPMHPEVRSAKKEGRCPECGMALVPTKEKHSHQHSGHDRHEGHVSSSFLFKFWLTLIFTIPIFLYSEMARMLFGIEMPSFLFQPLVLLCLGSIIFFYCGWVFLVGAYHELRARLPGMMTLIALAISTAYLYSAIAILSGQHKELLFELSSLIAIMLLGHWIEMRSVQGAQGALRALAKLMPDEAEVLRDRHAVTVPLADLLVGDLVVLRPGTKVPADGVVVDGISEVDESVITGESRPVSKKDGSSIIAGSRNGDGRLTVRVEKIGDETFLSGIMRLVADAESSKSRLQILSDRAAFYLTVVAIISGALTFTFWIFSGAGFSLAVERLVAVLVITCPHALGLAVPLVASISTTMAAQRGFLVRQRLALEVARTIDTVIFDKTGTLTEGVFSVDHVFGFGGETEEKVIELAASVNQGSEHSLGNAIVQYAQRKEAHLLETTAFQRVPGKGALATVGGQIVRVGNRALMTDAGVMVDASFDKTAQRLEQEGKTAIFVSSGTSLIGVIALADQIRPESKEAILTLQKAGIQVMMVTGDSEDVAQWVARELGLDRVVAKVLPDAKAAIVKELQNKRHRVAMVGDGVNDAPALTQADLGVAIGAGTNVAIESAGIILVNDDPRDISRIITLSKLTYTKMIQNLFWATGYNVIAIPLAAGVLASRGIILEPAIAAICMSLSTVIVAINAVLLRRRTI